MRALCRRIGCIGLAIASYIILAIGVAIYTRANLGGRTFLAWPDWCFFLALGGESSSSEPAA